MWMHGWKAHLFIFVRVTQRNFVMFLVVSRLGKFSLKLARFSTGAKWASCPTGVANCPCMWGKTLTGGKAENYIWGWHFTSVIMFKDVLITFIFALRTDPVVLFEKTAQDVTFSVISYLCLRRKYFEKGCKWNKMFFDCQKTWQSKII